MLTFVYLLVLALIAVTVWQELRLRRAYSGIHFAHAEITDNARLEASARSRLSNLVDSVAKENATLGSARREDSERITDLQDILLNHKNIIEILCRRSLQIDTPEAQQTARDFGFGAAAETPTP